MIFYPKMYLENILEIKYEMLEANGIKGIILDMDNTLIDFHVNILNGVKQWAEDLKEKGIKLIIVSNSNKIEKLEKTSRELKIDYIKFGMKPLKKGLKKAQKILQLKPENIAVAGDQLFTDIWGANRCKMFSILVKPLDEKDILLTIIKRPLENHIIKRYLKKINNKEKKNVHK